ncbi:MAG: hypothetical protein CL988_05975 [Euryarchaeota archaeon]|nr:hypothetical protein [Euryarchaeota archaeon]
MSDEEDHDKDAGVQQVDLIVKELQELFDQLVEFNSQSIADEYELENQLHSPGKKGITTDKQLAEIRKTKVEKVINKLGTNVDFLMRSVEKRFDGELKGGRIDEISAEIDSELRRTIQDSNAHLEVLEDFIDRVSLQERWDSAIEFWTEKHGEELDNVDELLRNNIFIEYNPVLLQEYVFQGDSSSTPDAYSFIKMILLHAFDSVFGCITALIAYILNTNEDEKTETLFSGELNVESYGDAALRVLSKSEVLAGYDYPMSKEDSDEINTILHSLTWSLRKFSTTLESIPIGEGRYKPTLSDVNSHVVTNPFRPRETYKNLGMWPLEREKDYYSLSELDLNNWLGIEQHSHELSCNLSLHKIYYRDFLDFVQKLGYEHKKVTSYEGFRRLKPTLTMFDWDKRSCKYRPNVHIYFYNPKCPIAGTEIRIVVHSSINPFAGKGDLNLHVGLSSFSKKSEVDSSVEGSDDEQILLTRETGEQFLQQMWKDFDTYQREKGLLKNSKFDATITQLNPKGRTFDDMILSESKKKLLDENIFAILSNSERLIERGVETNRGIMLAGPPGVGKSLTIDAVISKADCTVIFTNFLMLRNDMEGIFELSRRYAPTVLILEDIDALGITAQRGQGGSGAGLSTLLNCMDGINSNNGVISVATSNHPEQMDWALIARPGRFDVRIDYPYPEKDVLKSIMKLKLSSYSTNENIDLDSLIKTMPLGFTGSHIHDIVNQANYISINNSKAAPKKVKITQESLASATERTLYNFNKFLNERPHIQLQNPPSVQEVLKGSKGKKENYHQ